MECSLFSLTQMPLVWLNQRMNTFHLGPERRSDHSPTLFNASTLRLITSLYLEDGEALETKEAASAADECCHVERQGNLRHSWKIKRRVVPSNKLNQKEKPN